MQPYRNRVLVSTLLCSAIAACSPSPVGPSQTRTAAPAIESVTASDSHIPTEAASMSPADLVARGWDCRQAPTSPTVVTCSPPNQPHPITLPGPPPPEDRPATFTLLVFDSGVFVGTTLLIRSDLYQGQLCKSTEAPYRLIARIGYYECRHEPQAD